MPRKKRPTEEERIHNAVVGRLLAYRRYVGMMAGKYQLRAHEEDDLAEISDRLNVPCWAIPRDVRAAIEWQTADSIARARLLHAHPRLFEEADTWVNEFLCDNGRRRSVRLAAVVDDEPEAS